MEELIDHWHNSQLMHPGRDKMQQDLEWRFKFPPGYYALLDKYCSDCAMCRATKSPNHSGAGNPVYTAIPEAPMRSVAMDVFAMPEVTVDGETYDCVILAVAGRQMFEKFRQLHIDEPGRNSYNSLWRVLQAYHDLPGPTGLSPHRILFLRDGVSRTLPWLNHGKVARDANAMMTEADDTAAKVCKVLQDEHEKRAKYFKQGKVQKYALQDTVWVERHHKDVLSRHGQASWYVPGVIVRKVGQDVYAVRVGDNKILDGDHTQLRPRAPDPSGRPVTFEFTPAMCTRTTRVRTTTSPPRRSWRTSRTRGRLGGGFRKSVERDSPHPGIRGSLRAALCRGTPRSGWSIWRKRTFLWMSRTCWCIWWLQ